MSKISSNADLLSVGKANVTPQNMSGAKNGKIKNSFDSIMNGTIKSKDYFEARKKEKSFEMNSISEKQTVEDTSVDMQKVKAYNKYIKTSNDASTTNVVEEADVKEDVTGLDELLLSIEDTLLKKLGITKEELEKHLEMLGFHLYDLIDMDNLKELVLLVNGASDMSEVLTNETLANTLNNVIQSMDDLFSNDKLGVNLENLEDFIVKNEFVEEVNLDENAKVDSFDEQLTTIQTNEIPVTIVNEKDTDGMSQDVMSNSQDNTEAFVNEVSGNEDKDTNLLEHVIHNLSNVSNLEQVIQTEGMEQITEVRDIVNQIVEQIKIHIGPEDTSMEIQLNPENLGKLQLTVTSKDGVMTAQLNTSNQVVKEVIESQMQLLKDNLNNQGLKVDAIEVTVSNFSLTSDNNHASYDGQAGSDSGKRRFFRGDIPDMMIANQDDERLDSLGSTVEYTV